MKISKCPLKTDKGFTLTELAFSVAIMSIISIAVSTLLTASYQAQVTHRTSALVESISMNFTEQLRRDVRLAIAVSTNGNFSDQVPNNSARGSVFSPPPSNILRLYYTRDNNGNLRQDRQVVYQIDNNNGRIRRVANYDPESRQDLNQLSDLIFVGQRLDGTEDINGLVGRCVNLQPQTANSGNNVVVNNQGCFRFSSTVLYNDINQQTISSANPQRLQSFLTRVTVNGLQIGPDPNDRTPIIFPVDAFGRPVYNIRQTSFELGGAKIFR